MAFYSIINLDQLALLLDVDKMVDEQEYRKTLLEAIDRRGKEFWNRLPRRIQQWYNLNVDLFQSGKPLIGLPPSQRQPSKLGIASRDTSVHNVLVEALVSNPFLTNKELWMKCMDRRVITSLNTVAQYASSIRGVLRELEARGYIKLPDKPPSSLESA